MMNKNDALLYKSGVFCKILCIYTHFSFFLKKRTVFKMFWVFKTSPLSCFRLDYSGIAFLIMGSFVPWLYYSFYCSPQPCVVYLIVVCILGLAAITVSQCDFFATPQYRGVRAGKQSYYTVMYVGKCKIIEAYRSLLLRDCLHWASYRNVEQDRMRGFIASFWFSFIFIAGKKHQQ